ncbi:MAG: zf-HC2 domain-containing protein [Phycisphaerales bacterium]|nr:MAG: zf-HC2 domain-containing protein [Phycisphaerales bacterium]
MTCQDHKDLMMAYLDDELDQQQKRAFEEHLASCAECARQLDEFRRLKQLTDSVSFIEPEDRIWQQYWDNVYNRVERGLGWILFSMAAILLAIYGGFKLIETIVTDPDVGALLKVALLVLIGGLAILFVSLLRERLYFWGKDRYKDVRR